MTSVYSSPLLRARQTASRLAADLGLELEIHDGLREISAGDLEMRTDDRSKSQYVEYLVQWMRGDLSFRIPGGTSGTEFLDAFTTALGEIVEEQRRSGTVAVLTHGAAMRVFLALRAGFSLEASERMWVHNTGMAGLEGDPWTGWRLTDWVVGPVVRTPTWP